MCQGAHLLTIVIFIAVFGLGLFTATIACTGRGIVDCGTGSEASEVVWEGFGSNIDVDILTTVGGQSSSIADITVVTLPGVGISVLVWSKENMTILGQTDWRVPSRALEVRILAVSD